ncbi:MAG TPA: tetratricopeptide repeat protein, partial [Kofleriaceae bacterium]|nr:tetratricopeptide repeat protein [Kofleriaceae bacterium]
MLRRLAILYETRLADVDGVVFASSAVLELLTGDRDALERMERVLDKAGDPRLEQTLEYHAAASTSPAERAKLLKRLARIAVARDDDVGALDRWEQTLRASPADPDALAALSQHYDRAGRWPELAQVLERRDGGRPLPAPGTPEAAVRALDLEHYATVLDNKLGDTQRAIRAWHRLLELTPKSRTALDALARLYRGASKWRELADVLGAQVALLAEQALPDDAERATAAAIDRAAILEDKLGAPGDAIKVLDHLIRELNPNHLEAHTALRRLYEARGDFDAAVRVAEREMYLAPEPQRKIARGLEIGLICRDRLSNPTRALQAFKRVLELEPGQDEALAAAADLLARLGRWKEHVAMLERMLAQLPDGDGGDAGDDGGGSAGDPAQRAEARRAIVQRIATATADKLGDPKAAFRWWRRAHDEAPDEHTLDDVRRAGEAYALWRELSDVLTDERKRLVALGSPGAPAEPERFGALSRELAALSERRLGDRPRAIAVLAEALAVAPRDPGLLGELDRLAAEHDQRSAWKALLEAYDVALAAATPLERVELHLRRARLLDDRLGDPKAAVGDVLAAFSWAPDRDDIRDALVALAGKARAWHDVIAIDSALIERAPTAVQRAALLRRKAAVIEDQLKDAPRAFRTHLIALVLAPDDTEIASHLWRLARVIGKYREADRSPQPEPPPAMIQAEAAVAEAVASAGRVPGIRTLIPRRLATEPLADADLTPATLAVGDSTQPLDVDELELADHRRPGNPFGSENSTMTLSPQDLRTMMVPPRLPPGAKGPPRPPPRPPQIRPQARPGFGPGPGGLATRLGPPPAPR